MRNFLTHWYPLIAVVALILLIVTVGGCAGYRDGRSLVCMGWCWQIEGETVVTPPDLKDIRRSQEPQQGVKGQPEP